MFMNQDHQNELTEAAFAFGQNFFRILLSETPSDKKATLLERMKEIILHLGSTLEINLPNVILDISCKMVIADAVAKIDAAFSATPAAKLSLQKTLFSAVIDVMAKKYGWESGVSEDNEVKLRAELKEKGLFFNGKTQSRALKTLARKNINRNIDSALDGTLMNDLVKIIFDQRSSQQNQSKSEFVYEPISSEVDAETKSKIRELLFKRRNENGKPD